MSEAPHSSENTEQKLSNAEFKRVMFLNFMHSQGDLVLQYAVSCWLRRYYGAQSPEMIDSVSAEFLDDQFTAIDAKTDVLNLATKETHSATIPNAFGEQVPVKRADASAQLASFRVFKEARITVTEEEILNAYFGRTIMTDLMYLENGRPGRARDGVASLKDRYFSFFVHYIVDDSPTGDKALDALCDKARERIATYSRPQDIEALKNLYNQRQAESQSA